MHVFPVISSGGIYLFRFLVDPDRLLANDRELESYASMVTEATFCLKPAPVTRVTLGNLNTKLLQFGLHMNDKSLRFFHQTGPFLGCVGLGEMSKVLPPHWKC